jgi:selT/selW/selH-like putative selenoprotein
VEAEIRKDFPEAKIKLVEGGGGIFDVTCDGTLIFSKQKIEGQRFPEEGEVARLIGGK